VKRRGFLAGALGMLWTVHATAEPDLNAILARIAKSRDELETLRASFVQTRKIGLLATEVKSKGRLTLVMPDRLRWDLLAPDDVSYWIGPKGLAMRNAEGVSRVSKGAAGRFASVLGDLRIMLGGDLRKLTKRYALSVAETKGRHVITAKPKDKKLAKHFARLQLETDSKAALLQKIIIVEKNGDSSVIVFDGHQKNKPVKPSEIDPPK
jgi:outer membrane lipoprotein-sorting protein